MKIRECCILLGVEEKKIVWKKKKLLFVDMKIASKIAETSD